MNWFTQWSTRTYLSCIFALLVLYLSWFGYKANQELGRLETSHRDLGTLVAAQLDYLQETQGLILMLSGRAQGALFADPRLAERMFDNAQPSEADFFRSLDSYMKRTTSEEQRKVAKELEGGFRAWSADITRILQRSRTGKPQELQEPWALVARREAELLAQVNGLISFHRKQREDFQTQFSSSVQHSARQLVYLAIGGVILVVGAGLGLYRLVAEPIRRLRRDMELLAAADRTQRLRVEGRDEIAQLAWQINLQLDQLQQTDERLAESLRLEKVSSGLEHLLSSFATEDVFIREALDCVRGCFGWAAGSCWRVDSTVNGLRLISESGSSERRFSQGASSKLIRPGEGMVGRTWQLAEVNLQCESISPSEVHRSSGRAGPARSVVCIPLLQNSKVLGVLEFQVEYEGNSTIPDLEVLRRLARNLSTALDRLQSQAEVARYLGMVDNAPINLMFADRDLVIRYANPAVLKTLRSVERLLPMKVDSIVGHSIDSFHRDPLRQRKFLADPAHLPVQAQIQLGAETFDLTVSAVHDQKKITSEPW